MKRGIALPRVPARPGEVAKTAWLLLALLTVGGYLAGLAVRGRELQQVCLEGAEACQARPERPTPENAAALEADGLTLTMYARLQVGKLLFFSSVWFAVGTLIFARRRDDWMALLVAAVLVTFPTLWDGISEVLARHYPTVRLPAEWLRALVNNLYVLFFALFPNGRWAPRWTRWLVAGLIGLGMLEFLLPGWLPKEGTPPLLIPQVALLGLLVAAQVVRYRRYSTPGERQQTR
jgi:hypothetical protein